MCCTYNKRNFKLAVTFNINNLHAITNHEIIREQEQTKGTILSY
jgi:hypothetical protein